MKGRSLAGFVCLIGLVVVLWWQQPRPAPDAVTRPQTVEDGTGISQSATEEPLLGEVLLEDYATPNGNIRQDLRYIQRLLMSVRTLVKTQDPGRMAVNEDVVEVFLGKNDYKIAFLPRSHPAINEAGQLIDRWGTPLFFHLKAANRLDIRSAGPDRTLFTSDDCHLQADGAFL